MPWLSKGLDAQENMNDPVLTLSMANMLGTIIQVLETIATLLIFLTGMVVSFGMLQAYAINEHSKHDLTPYIRMLWIFVAIGASVSFVTCYQYVF